VAGGQTTPEYKVTRRSEKRVVKKPPAEGRHTVIACTKTLKEIWIHVDEQNTVGVVTFVTTDGHEIRRTLVYTWYPQGTYTLKFVKNSSPPPAIYTQLTAAENVDPIFIDRIKKMKESQQKWFNDFQFVVEGGGPIDIVTECLIASGAGREIRLRVTYVAATPGEKGGKLPTKLLSDDYLSLLRNEYIARLFIMLLEHFAGILVEDMVAAGGISRAEYEAILKKKPNNPDLDARTIARVLTQGTFEYVRAYGDKLDFLPLLIEAILYQRKRKNALAVANQLEIAKGLLRLSGGKLEEDLGVKKRGDSTLLLYDKYGNAVPAFVGYMDIYYRNVDLGKVPMIKITLGTSAEADMLRVLEQTFSYPLRETYLFFASMGDFYKFIVEEIYRLYNGEIGRRIVEMLPMALGFFVVHAVLGAMARRGNPYAVALLVIAKAVGWVMNVDMGLTTVTKLAEAGRHFGMMEKIHRQGPKEKGKEKLTQLSLYHLELGTHALIEAMTEIFAMGFFIAAGKLGGKTAETIGKYARRSRAEARIEITVQDGKVTQIRAVKGQATIEVQAEPVEGARGIERTTPTGKKLRLVDSAPIEEAGPNLGTREKSAKLYGKEVVKVLEYKYKTRDPKGRPAASEEAAGMPEQHLRMALEVAREQNVVVIFRTTNPRSVQHILKGHPPKGKDLIDLHTSHETGKVTALGKAQYKIAWRKGYYTLTAEGYAYNPYAKGPKFLEESPGVRKRFPMDEKGAFGEQTHKPGQVIEPKSGKAVVGDYDLQDVILPNSQGRQIAAVPDAVGSDVRNPIVNRVINAFNAKLKASGDPHARIVHGADAQFIQRIKVRPDAFRGDAIAVLPDGRVAFFTPQELAGFYRSIGRSRLDLPSKRTKLTPSKVKK
jgi:hypothetical protein